MSTTTVRLTEDEERSLERIAPEYGGKSNALRAGLGLVVAEAERRERLRVFLDDWEAEDGPVDQADIDATASRLGL